MNPGDPAEPRELAGRLAHQIAVDYLRENDQIATWADTWERISPAWRELFMRVAAACWDKGRAVERDQHSAIRTTHTLKTVREALSAAQTALSYDGIPAWRAHRDTIQDLINDIDRQRPLGPDGKHGNRHTPTCGCNTPPNTHHHITGGTPLPDPQTGDHITVTWDGQPDTHYRVTHTQPDGSYTLQHLDPGPIVIPQAGTWRIGHNPDDLEHPTT